MITIQQVNVYVTADGKQFLDPDDALRHEVQKLVFSSGDTNTFSVDDAVKKIVKNGAELYELLGSMYMPKAPAG